MDSVITSRNCSRTRSVVYVALCIALTALGAWINVPFGPVPFTLQTFAIMFALFVLTPAEALCAIAGYTILGALGLPVFAGFSGGIGTILGPTGGFIVGWTFAAAAALAIARAVQGLSFFNSAEKKSFLGVRIAAGQLASNFLKGIIFMVILYVFGWAWLALSTGMDPAAAFAVAVAPFVIIDFLKMVAAVLVAQPVLAAIRR